MGKEDSKQAEEDTKQDEEVDMMVDRQPPLDQMLTSGLAHLSRALCCNLPTILQQQPTQEGCNYVTLRENGQWYDPI